MRSTCISRVILHLFILAVLGEEYRLCDFMSVGTVGGLNEWNGSAQNGSECVNLLETVGLGMY
jgi:hypothetical protein